MEELDKTGYPKQIDGGVDPKKISAEWLNDIISSNIRPPLQGVRINPVSLDTLFPGKVAYVIYIPQSHDAHQAADKKYYRRQEFKSEPMYDHEIRDAMNRRQHPKIKPSVSFRLASDEDGKGWMIIGLLLLCHKIC